MWPAHGARHARIVLFDNEQVRAVMTASWLIQLGWTDVHVYGGPVSDWPLETGAKAATSPPITDCKTTAPMDVDLKADFILDLSDSLTYRREHVPGAHWGVRSRPDEVVWPDSGRVVLYADDDRLAHLAAQSAAGLVDVEILVLAGGLDAWRAAGLPVQADDGKMALATTATNDVWYKPYDTDDQVRAKMEEYLVWEVGLVDQINRDDTVHFRVFDQ